MSREEQDKKLLEWKKILDYLKLPFFLNQSTALAIYRDGHNFPNNQSVDIGVLDDDFTKQVKDGDINSEIYQVVMTRCQGVNQGRFKRTIMYCDNNQVEIQIVFFYKGKAVYNLIDDDCLVYDENHFKKFDKIKYLDTEFNIPSDTDRFFETYYGKDWRTPTDKWHWKSAPNYKKYDEI